MLTCFIKPLLLCTILAAVNISAQDKDLSLNEKIAIQNLTDHILHDRVETVAKQINYPLCRNSYYNYNIDSADTFIELYHQIFDAGQKQKFSELKWQYFYIRQLIDDGGYYSLQASGFCGFFNEEGLLYLDTIPLSETEDKYIHGLIENEKLQLHPSIRNYKEPICLVHVGKYRIRIDRMYDDSIRYSSWKKDSPTSSKPDIVINNGDIFGNRWHTMFTFKNGEYEYRLFDGVLDDTPVLSITRGHEVILELDQDYSFKYF